MAKTATPADKQVTYVVDEETAGERLDVYITNLSDTYSRSSAKTLIKNGHVELRRSRKKIKAIPNTHIQAKDKVIIKAPQISEELVLKVIYEDEDFLVIDKPAGVLSHPRNSQLETEDTVEKAAARLINDETFSEPLVHRLDRYTSGLMVLAKHETAKQHLQEQFSNRRVNKFYIALVNGLPEAKHYIINWPLGRDPNKPAAYKVASNGREAVSEIIKVEQGSNTSGVLIKPLTGRTHQIRIHLAHLGYPVIGDRLYGEGDEERYYLHSYKLSFNDMSGKNREYISSVPKEMKDMAKAKSVKLRPLYEAAK